MELNLHPSTASAFEPEPSLETSDEFQPAPPPSRECPTALLSSFALAMHGHGRRVSTLLMLVDPEYALWQLACARAMNDPQLSVLAARLFFYVCVQRGMAHSDTE